MDSLRKVGLGVALALAGAAMVVPLEPNAEPNPSGSARNRPSGSNPVSGGGARERARRLARMKEAIK